MKRTIKQSFIKEACHFSTKENACGRLRLGEAKGLQTQLLAIHINNDMNINIHIDINMNIDIHIIIDMNI